MAKITGVDYMPLAHIVHNLRPEDIEEFEAARGEKFDRKRLTEETEYVAKQGFGWIAWRGDTQEPVATWGAYRICGAVAGCWAFGTPGWVKVVRSVTRQIRKDMIPTLLRAGFHRAECRALAKRDDTRLWLTGLGWVEEAVLAEFGIRREPFVLYAWTASNHVTPPQPDLADDSRQRELPLCWA